MAAQIVVGLGPAISVARVGFGSVHSMVWGAMACHPVTVPWARRVNPLPPEPWQDLAQVVAVRDRSAREPATVDVAIIMRTGGGGYTHRRMGCVGGDFMSALPHLFYPDPEALMTGGYPSTPRRVHDQHFDVFEQALKASQMQDQPAHPDWWRVQGLGTKPNDYRLPGSGHSPGQELIHLRRARWVRWSMSARR